MEKPKAHLCSGRSSPHGCLKLCGTGHCPPLVPPPPCPFWPTKPGSWARCPHSSTCPLPRILSSQVLKVMPRAAVVFCTLLKRQRFPCSPGISVGNRHCWCDDLIDVHLTYEWRARNAWYMVGAQLTLAGRLDGLGGSL